MSQGRLRIYNHDEIPHDEKIEARVNELGAIGAFEEERGRMLALLEDVGRVPGLHELVWSIGDALWPAFHECGYHQAGLSLFRVCADAARSDGRRDAEARMLALCSRCAADLGDESQSLELIERAEKADDGENDTLTTSIMEFRGAALAKAGCHDDAIGVYEQARERFERAGDVRGAMLVDYLIGKECEALGDLSRACRYHEKAACAVDKESDTPSAIKMYYRLAEVKFCLSEYESAAEAAAEAFRLSTDGGYWRHGASVTDLLVRCLHELGDDDGAVALACELLAHADDYAGAPDLEQIIDRFNGWGLGGKLRRNLMLRRMKTRLAGILSR